MTNPDGKSEFQFLDFKHSNNYFKNFNNYIYLNIYYNIKILIK